MSTSWYWAEPKAVLLPAAGNCWKLLPLVLVAWERKEAGGEGGRAPRWTDRKDAAAFPEGPGLCPAAPGASRAGRECRAGRKGACGCTPCFASWPPLLLPPQRPGIILRASSSPPSSRALPEPAVWCVTAPEGRDSDCPPPCHVPPAGQSTWHTGDLSSCRQGVRSAIDCLP